MYVQRVGVSVWVYICVVSACVWCVVCGKCGGVQCGGVQCMCGGGCM